MVHNFEIELWLFIWNMSLGWAQKALSQVVSTKVDDNTKLQHMQHKTIRMQNYASDLESALDHLNSIEIQAQCC
jgi:hypothetical protein